MAMDSTAKQLWERHFGNEQYGKDCCGALMFKGAHGQQGNYGWEIDHIHPKSKGGQDVWDNLRPLHWENNDAKSDNYDGQWTCAKIS